MNSAAVATPFVEPPAVPGPGCSPQIEGGAGGGLGSDCWSPVSKHKASGKGQFIRVLHHLGKQHGGVERSLPPLPPNSVERRQHLAGRRSGCGGQAGGSPEGGSSGGVAGVKKSRRSAEPCSPGEEEEEDEDRPMLVVAELGVPPLACPHLHHRRPACPPPSWPRKEPQPLHSVFTGLLFCKGPQFTFTKNANCRVIWHDEHLQMIPSVSSKRISCRCCSVHW